MSTPFQNRLVGTIIVAAAAIIFLPDLLNGEKKSHKDTFEAMPLAPKVMNVAAIKKFPSKKLSRLSSDEISNDVAQDQQLFAVNHKPEKSTKTAVTKQSKLLKSSVTSKHTKKSLVKSTKKSVASVVKPNVVKQVSSTKSKSIVNNVNAWVIQLGSFRERHNVDSLIKKLKKNGYTAYSKPIKTRHGNLIKVFVGPELSKSLLASKLNKLEKLTNMQGKIARFKADK
ncbi:MAG: SPOR domain-containing protein [Alteromonadaceae bacterium]|nr:SPOR domain-containing protein [Alteromonadaceae bacterium]